MSFNKLLEAIKLYLEVNMDMAGLRGGAILPEICHYMTLRYLAGGLYSDIQLMCGISVSSFYRIVCKTINAINTSSSSLLSIKFPQTVDEVKETATGFQTISKQAYIWTCVSVSNCYHLQIQTPSKKEANNVK
jgi:hypothetical protein